MLNSFKQCILRDENSPRAKLHLPLRLRWCQKSSTIPPKWRLRKPWPLPSEKGTARNVLITLPEIQGQNLALTVLSCTRFARQRMGTMPAVEVRNFKWMLCQKSTTASHEVEVLPKVDARHVCRAMDIDDLIPVNINPLVHQFNQCVPGDALHRLI